MSTRATLVLRAKELARHAQTIADRCGCRVIPRVASNPTLAHHGLAARARWHITTAELPTRAVADLYTLAQPEAHRVARLLAVLLDRELHLLDNAGAGSTLRSHRRVLATPGVAVMNRRARKGKSRRGKQGACVGRARPASMSNPGRDYHRRLPPVGSTWERIKYPKHVARVTSTERATSDGMPPMVNLDIVGTSGRGVYGTTRIPVNVLALEYTPYRVPNPVGAAAGYWQGWRRAWAACLSGRAAVRPGTPSVAAPSVNPPHALSVSDRHQLKVARDTLKLSADGARIMGGPTHAEARDIIYRLTGRRAPNPSRSSAARAARTARRRTRRTQAKGIGGRRTVRALSRGELRRAQHHALQSKYRYQARHTPVSGNPSRSTAAAADHAVEDRQRASARRRNPAGAVDKATTVFRKWQDRGAIPVRKRQVRAPRPLRDAAAELGQLVAVTYRSDKYDGRVKDHEHVFKAPLASLVTDPEGRDLHVVRGRSRYAITPDGITN